MRLSRAIQDYLNDCRLGRRSPGTIVTYENVLGRLLNHVSLHAHDQVHCLTPELVRTFFIAASERGNSTETLMKKRATLRSFTRWGLGRRLWNMDPMIEAPSYRRPGRLPRPFQRHEREALMGLALDAEENALRAVLYYGGLRESEVLALRIRDVRFPQADRPGHLAVRGKGNQERIVPMTEQLAAALGDHLMDRTDGNRFVFCRGYLPWTARMVRYRVARWGTNARVDDCIPHRFRHTAATELFEFEADPRAAQRFLGHKSITTTMLYTAVTDLAVEEAVAKREAGLRRREVLRQNSQPRPTGAGEV